MTRLIGLSRPRHDEMVGVVETMLKLNKDLPKAKTPHERETIKRQIAATDELQMLAGVRGRRVNRLRGPNHRKLTE